MQNIVSREPVMLASAINAALVSTWGVVVILADIRADVAGGVTAAIGAWVVLLGVLTRQRVSPVE